VVGPLLYLTVTIEQEDGSARVHLHPGGQGFWIARMITALGCQARLVSPIGGEAGDVLAALLPSWQVELRALRTSITSPTQVHDRRSGERVEIVEVEHPALDRHEANDLYAIALETALTSHALVLTAAATSLLDADSYRRLLNDVGAQGVPVFADLHGEPLDAVLDGGRLDLLKVSEDDLREDGWSMGSEAQAVAAARELASRGVETVVVSRGNGPAIAASAGQVMRVVPPALEEVDHRGAGDSMTAGMVVGRLIGLSPIAAVALGAAAGAANVTRHGLGSGRPELIAELAGRVVLEEVR
jgi:1-phosphofructokinase